MWEWSSRSSSIHLTSLLSSSTLQAISHKSRSASVVEQVYRLVKSFSNVNYSLAGIHYIYIYICSTYVSMRLCGIPIQTQLKFPILLSWLQLNKLTFLWERVGCSLEASGENSVCVAADEPIHPFGGFVCFDLALSVQVNIIVKTWQAVFKECSRLLIRLLLLIFWANDEFTKYEVNMRSQWQELLKVECGGYKYAPVHFAMTRSQLPSAPLEKQITQQIRTVRMAQ